MPSRWLCAAILAFWLAANAWLVWRDIVPTFETGQPPPFTIDFLDEVELERPVDTAWNVFHNGAEEYRTITRVVPHKEDDTFEMTSRQTINHAKVPEPRRPKPIRGGLVLEQLDSSYRITREGALRELSMDLDTRKGPRAAEITVGCQIHGEVRGELFYVHVGVHVAGLNLLALNPDPVPVSQRASVLSPMHPIQRIQGLRAGQQWRMPFVNPLTDALAAANIPGITARPRMLDAHVLSEPQNFRWRGRDRSCLVIEYSNDDCHARTWVEQDGSLVLCQEFTVEDDTWKMVREH
jgi:hypothetical protein